MDTDFVPVSSLLEGAIPLGRALALASGLSDALANLHRSGLIHNAITAETVEVEPRTGTVRLAASSRSERVPTGGMLPAPVRLEADPRYVAPECSGRMNRPVDVRADLYSAGVVIYLMLTGRLPFQARDPAELIHMHMARPPTPPSERRHEIPEPVSAVVMRLLAKDPEDRYQNASGLSMDLATLAEAWRENRSLDGFVPGQQEEERSFRVSSRLVGRKEEVATLMAALDRCAWGGVELVFVRGPPGIGKSVLVEEVRRRAPDRGAFIVGKYEQYHRTVPYSALASAFGSLLRRILAKPNEVVAAWRDRIRGTLGANAQLMTDLIPDLVHVIGPQPPAPHVGPGEVRNRFNRVFRDFVGVFAREDHPLVVFLDDLQWADTASLNLIEVLLTEPNTTHLLLLGSYRDTEVDTSHPLSLVLESLRNTAPETQELTLEPLTADQTRALVAASVSRLPEACTELSSLLRDRTGGNPFFLGQFLNVLHQRGLVTFDEVEGAWTWKQAEIDAQGFTSEVSEFVADRLQAVPEHTRDALMAAACLGASFDARTLAVALGEDPERTAGHLGPALRAGLIEPRSQGRQVAFAFTHDRIQQAAFGLIPEGDVSAYRYRIGSLVLESLSENELDKDLFQVVENLNSGAVLDLAQTTRTRLAELNLMAGRRARESLAYEDAVRLLRVGIDLLPPKPWKSEYAVAFGLHAECFECEYLLGDFEAAEGRFEELVRHARDRLDYAKIHYTRVLLDTSRGRYAEAVSAGMVALQDFGITLPDRPRQWHILWELTKARLYLGLRRVEDLEELPELKDPDQRAVARLLVSICPAAYFHDPKIMTLAGLKIVNMSLRKGKTPASPFGYVLLALVLGAGLGRYRRGHEFGRLAVLLADQDKDIALRSKVVMIFGGFVEFWTRPVDLAIQRVKDAFRIALEAGDHQYANYSALQLEFLHFFRGAPLDAVLDEAERFGPFIHRTRDTFSIDSHRVLHQAVLALRGETGAGWSLTAPDWNEEAEVECIRRRENSTTLFYYRVWKLQLLYLFGRLDKALEVALVTESEFEAGFSQICQYEQSLFSGLTAATLLIASPRDRELKRLLRLARRRLGTWASTCPENFLAGKLLLEAEAASLRGSGNRALHLYDQAIESARVNGFLNLEALANERAADFHSRSGRRGVSSAYRQEAQRAYRAWGATSKVEDLAGAARPIDEERPTESPSPAEYRDIDAAIKAAHAIAEEVELESLLERLVRVTLEAAGAQRCALVLDEGEEGLRIQASGRVAEDHVEVLSSLPLDDGAELCVAVVLYAARTLRPLAVEDARMDDRFRQSPYVKRHAPVSILALPVMRQGILVGVLYLENNLTAGAFTPERLAALEIVASELAVALDNARLTQRQGADVLHLQDALRRVESLQQAKTHLAKFVPQSVQQIIDANPHSPALDKERRDVSVLFLDIAGYTRITHALKDSQVDHLLERYFSAFLHDIHRHGGDISETLGDGLMILFLHDDPMVHAIQAVRAALAIQARTEAINAKLRPPFEPVTVNIGINSGEALVGSTKFEARAGTRYTYTALGAVTNIAARIAAAAEDGSILISTETARRIRNRFELEDHGLRSFKNVEEPVGVARLLKEIVTADEAD